MDDILDQIEKSKSNKHITKRAVSDEVEAILFDMHKVLDHGFIRVIDYMGNDAAIVQAARVSYGEGTKQISNDKGLINYLMRNGHTSPFEMCEIKLHVKLPIFVARQWIRHRTANVNEYSARYSILRGEFYIPTTETICEQSSDNKQGRGEKVDEQFALRVTEMIRNDAITAYHNYQNMLNINDDNEIIDNNRPCVAREIARINLPLSTYTEFYWKIDLHNLLHFLKLRTDPHAQYEIREYAKVMLEIVKKWVPYTYEAFVNYTLNSIKLRKESTEVIKKLLHNEDIKFEESGLSKGEWNSLMDQFEITNKKI